MDFGQKDSISLNKNRKEKERKPSTQKGCALKKREISFEKNLKPYSV